MSRASGGSIYGGVRIQPVGKEDGAGGGGSAESRVENAGGRAALKTLQSGVLDADSSMSIMTIHSGKTIEDMQQRDDPADAGSGAGSGEMQPHQPLKLTPLAAGGGVRGSRGSVRRCSTISSANCRSRYLCSTARGCCR